MSGDTSEATDHSPIGPSRVTCLVLAAGSSKRMGDRNKLLEPIDGIPMVATVVRTALASRADSVVVVTGKGREQVEACLSELPIDTLWNPDHAQGLSTSLRAGVYGLPDGTQAVVVCLGDMPRVLPSHIDALIHAFLADPDGSIFVPTWQGRRGNPVLWTADMLPEFGTLSGDLGAKVLMTQHETMLHEVPVDSAGILTDVDTPEALQALTATDDEPTGRASNTTLNQ